MENVKKCERNWSSLIVALHVLAVLIGLPIVFRDRYFDILNVKYYYYCGCVIVMAVGVALCWLWKLCKRDAKHSSKEGMTEKSGLQGKIRCMVRQLTLIDWAVLVFGLVSTISTVVSPFPFEAFWGNEGRYTGLFLLWLYVISYFCITRLFEMKAWYLDACLAAGLVVCLFGLTDFFQLDLLGFQQGIDAKQGKFFTSFIGNINTYTAMIAIYLGIASVLWVSCEQVWKSWWYYGNIWIGLLAIVTGRSDNAYLAIGAMLAILPLYAFQNRRGVWRYIALLATFLTSLKAVEWISIVYADQVLGINSLYNTIVGIDKLPRLIFFLWGLTLGVWLINRKKQNLQVGIWVRYVWLGILIAAVVALFFVLYDVNIAKHADKYASARSVLEFTDSWGTDRGYIWRLAIRDYKEFPLLQKLFGYGPDTFCLLTYFNNLKEMTERYGVFFDSVHNEYLQYFVTIGPIGLLAYLTTIVGMLVEVLKKGMSKPCVVAMAMGVLCYSAQAVVNINQAIATPVMWTLLCMAVAELRK